MKTLNIGVIGIGVIATTKHIPNLQKREDVRQRLKRQKKTSASLTQLYARIIKKSARILILT